MRAVTNGSGGRRDLMRLLLMWAGVMAAAMVSGVAAHPVEQTGPAQTLPPSSTTPPAPAVAPHSHAPVVPPHTHPELEQAASAAGTVEWDYSAFGVYGPTYTSPDEKNRVTLGFFSWFDNTFVTDDELAGPLGRDEIDGDSRIRTARLELHGNYTERFFYYFRVDFQDAGAGNGDASVEWSVVGLQDLPVVQNLMIGLQQPIYGLDIWGAYPRHRLLLEPSLLNAFYRGPMLGITAFDVSFNEGLHKYSWALGVARDTSEERVAGLQGINRGEDQWVAHGRFSWFPRYENQGTELIALGLSGAHFEPEEDEIFFGFYPEIFTDQLDLFPLINISEVDSSSLLVAEFRIARGPLWFQSDVLRSRTRRDNGDDIELGSWYVEGGWFLTGEQTVFTPLALNGQVAPAPVFDPDKGRYGALELQLRYSQLDLTDEEFRGGGPPFNQGADVTNYTLGVNWYLNAHIKFGINYVHSIREDLDDASFDAIQTRIAWNL